VTVRQQDMADREPALAHDLEQILDLVPGIDQHGLAASLAAEDESILVEGRSRPGFQDHQEASR
jgi:hypothetical protein